MVSIDTITECANCGKGEESTADLKACTACKLVKYCNRGCQIAHRPLHKKECKRRAAELHDEALFKEPPPRDECPICFLTLPYDESGTTFKSCCGKVICRGCIYAMEEARERGTESLCAFCREPYPTIDEEETKRIKEMAESGNAIANYNIGMYCHKGQFGFPQDYEKANKFMLRAGELGCAEAYHNLGVFYCNGDGVEVDKKKAKYFFELAAMNGSVVARHNLGCEELEAGNYDRAMKHFMLSARAGSKKSLDTVKKGFMRGLVTKDEYANILRANQRAHDEMKSDMRDRAEEFYQRLDNVTN